MGKRRTRNKFGQWLIQVPDVLLADLAELCDTSVPYLKQLGVGHRINPKLKLAMSIVDGSEYLIKKYGIKHLKPVTLRDLADIQGYESDEKSTSNQ